MGRGRRRGAARGGAEVDLLLAPDQVLDEGAVRTAGARAAGLPTRRVRGVQVLRRSVDARGGDVRVRLRVRVWTREVPQAGPVQPRVLPSLVGPPRVAVVGAGPAGLFCAWRLALRGVASVVLERGQPVARRRRDVADLSARGRLHPESNYCFGEGGAGTFSDGKLYTRSHKRGRVDEVLRELVAHGAPERILVDARPHIGTNRLPAVVGALRAHLESAGVLVRFGARVEELLVTGGRVRGVQLADGTPIQVHAVVLATGHSARDVYDMVARAGGRLERKPFAAGVRVEHPQEVVDRAQYGRWAGHPALGPASYRMVEPVGEARVFSFCMCPGGHIVPATTAPRAQVVNGWSPTSRRGRFANSGFVTEVTPAALVAEGLDPAEPLAGLEFQRRLEARAHAAGGGAFVGPAQLLADLLAGRVSGELVPCSYPRGVRPADLAEVLGPLAPVMTAGLAGLARRVPGFAHPAALLVGVESRTSAPVRIPRDRASLEHPPLPGLFPCAEGAGYAGGIMSAALDGIRVADRIAQGLSAGPAPARGAHA